MAGRDIGIPSDGREQLVPRVDAGGDPSCSPSHVFPQYELPLPGPLPSTSVNAEPVYMGSGGPGYPSTTNGTFVSSTGHGATGSMPAAWNRAVPGHAAAPGLSTSPRPAMPSTGGSSVMAAMEIQEALLPLQPAAPFEHPISLARRRWMVLMFCVVAALLFADQNLLAPNLTAAANYFGLNERQKDTMLGGALMAAFFAVGAPAALLVGWLTDRGDINRRTLLFWVVVVGETPCLLTYWVKSYWQFFLLRALTGVAVGGCFPLVFSLLGDLYPPGRRAAVSAVVQIATGLGLAAGQALSGSIGPATNWRLPFVVVAAPSLAVALLMLATTVEPPRGAFEEALRERYAEGLGAYEGSITWSKVVVLLRCPSNALVVGQGLPGSLPWGMVLTYFNDFLAQQKGFSVQAATAVLLFFAAGGAVGVIGGGAGGQWLYNKQKEYQALLAGGCVLAGIGPLYALINADLQRLGLAATCSIAALGGAVASVAGPNLRSVMLNVNEPETRGVALALQSMTDDLGKGLGPVLVAGLIHALGREGAFNVATAGWVPCGFMLAFLACCMRKDEAAMQARLAKSSQAQAAAAARAADGSADDTGAATGITVVLPPATPPAGSEGGAGPVGSALEPDTAAAPATATTPQLRKEEWRLAKVRLLAAADGLSYGRSDDSDADRSGIHATLPLSSSAAEADPSAGGRWWGTGGHAAGGTGAGGDACTSGGISGATLPRSREAGAPSIGYRAAAGAGPSLENGGASHAVVAAVATTGPLPLYTALTAQQQQQQQEAGVLLPSQLQDPYAHPGLLPQQHRPMALASDEAETGRHAPALASVAVADGGTSAWRAVGEDGASSSRHSATPERAPCRTEPAGRPCAAAEAERAATAGQAGAGGEREADAAAAASAGWAQPLGHGTPAAWGGPAGQDGGTAPIFRRSPEQGGQQQVLGSVPVQGPAS